LNIHIRSEGCDDPGKTAGTCGLAYIKVNGQDHSLHGRGHNVVIVDAKTGLWLLNRGTRYSEKELAKKRKKLSFLYNIWLINIGSSYYENHVTVIQMFTFASFVAVVVLLPSTL